MAVNSIDFRVISKTIKTDTTRRVDHIDVELMSKDVSGDMFITDVMFQSGTVATTWVGHVSEIQWTFDNG